MDKLTLAHDAALAMIKSGCSLHTAIAEAWKYADAMQAEADKRKPSGLPDALKEEWQPDWSQAPKWANWWAVDSDGSGYFFVNKPIIGNAIWMPTGSCVTGKAPSFNYQGNWQDSLRERPNGF